MKPTQRYNIFCLRVVSDFLFIAYKIELHLQQPTYVWRGCTESRSDLPQATLNAFLKERRNVRKRNLEDVSYIPHIKMTKFTKPTDGKGIRLACDLMQHNFNQYLRQTLLADITNLDICIENSAVDAFLRNITSRRVLDRA